MANSNTYLDMVECILGKIDHYTYIVHALSVMDIAIRIGEIMGLSRNRMKLLSISARYHDIGKVEINRYLLTKEGTLNQEEMSILRKHPILGYKLLSKFKGRLIPKGVPVIVLQHHERWNGGGYPSGLSEDDLKIESRILSVADVLDSMTKTRPFRVGLELKTALSEINKNSDVLFDPMVVSACLELFRRGYTIKS
ncbi:MAG: HD domain-containing phosphohydrolase [Syntrophales bacterium]